jgi:pyruvate dehydrogenase E1 component
MIALMGDAELDEGNIYECLIEAISMTSATAGGWSITTASRSTATTADRMFRRFDDIFETCGWRVITLKHGKLQRAAFARPGGKSLEDWIDNCPNAEFAALTYQGGAAWRARLIARYRPQAPCQKAARQATMTRPWAPDDQPRRPLHRQR